jgi:hypothetical protein
MKKSSTAARPRNKNFDQKLTIGLDLGDRSNWYCVLNEAGEVVGERKVATTPKACPSACSIRRPRRRKRFWRTRPVFDAPSAPIE